MRLLILLSVCFAGNACLGFNLGTLLGGLVNTATKGASGYAKNDGGYAPKATGYSTNDAGTAIYPTGRSTYDGGYSTYGTGRSTYDGGQSTYGPGRSTYDGGQSTYGTGRSTYDDRYSTSGGGYSGGHGDRDEGQANYAAAGHIVNHATNAVTNIIGSAFNFIPKVSYKEPNTGLGVSFGPFGIKLNGDVYPSGNGGYGGGGGYDGQRADPVPKCGSGFRSDGYGGCMDDDECRDKGKEYCGAYASCVNTHGAYQCACYSGYEKDHYGRCVDVDECKSGKSLCTYNEDCHNFDGGYACRCKPGYYSSNAKSDCVSVSAGGGYKQPTSYPSKTTAG